MATTSTAASSVTVALVGNPNTGKSTLFNALSGMRQRVGNYPGVTVEKRIGSLTHDGRRYELVDLPGTYSLAPHSPDEMVAVDVLLGRRADVSSPGIVIAIVDASNLQRNLYLVSQVLELARPVIVALNMLDLAEAAGVKIDVARLESQLGVPVIAMQANRRIGLDQLKAALATIAREAPSGLTDADKVLPGPNVFPDAFCEEARELEAAFGQRRPPRYLVERLLLDTDGYLEDSMLDGQTHLRQRLAAARTRLTEAGCPVPGVEATARYDWIARVLDGVVTGPSERAVSMTDRIDRVLTHKVWGTLVFVLLMLVMFRAVFSWAVPAMELIESAGGWLGGWVQATLADGALKSLLVDGVIAGVGGVLVFLPQIFILFFFIAVLEDCGYMARAAYLMDRLMVRAGLSGKSFIPLLSSFACAIPGVMAARVIENRRDRLTTILVAPLMSCSARLPIYTVLIAAFIPERTLAGGLLSFKGLTLFAMYLVGIITAVVVALVLKKTILKGETPAFVMELPSYKLPSLRVVLLRMLDRGWAFVRRAGTLIFAVSVVVWAAAYYPHNAATVEAPFRDRLVALETQIDAMGKDAPQDERLAELTEQRSQLRNEIAGAYQRQSLLGRAGQAVEPFVRPLGWDWRIGCAAIASFPAREVVVSTLGVIYNLGSDQDEASSALREQLKTATWDDSGEPVYNVPVALSIMVFFALCAQCAATLAVIKRETNSWRWPIFTFTYMTTLAYLGALATYQVGMLFVG